MSEIELGAGFTPTYGTCAIFFPGTSNPVDLRNLQNPADLESYLNAATVELVVLDELGEEVAGVTWPLAMDYLPGTNGNYRVYVPPEAEMRRHKRYLAKITATQDDYTRTFEFPIVVMD